MSVCGGLLTIVGESEVELRDGRVRFVHDFLVCEGISYPILGTDFFTSQSAVIDIPSQTLNFPGHKVAFTLPGSVRALGTEGSNFR